MLHFSLVAHKVVLALLVSALVASAVAYQAGASSRSPQWLREQQAYLVWCLWDGGGDSA